MSHGGERCHNWCRDWIKCTLPHFIWQPADTERLLLIKLRVSPLPCPPWSLYHVSRGDGVSVSHTNDSEDDTQVGDLRPKLTDPTHESSAGKGTGFENNIKLFTFDITPWWRTIVRGLLGITMTPLRSGKARQAIPGSHCCPPALPLPAFESFQ